jgi:hypothetical protein
MKNNRKSLYAIVSLALLGTGCSAIPFQSATSVDAPKITSNAATSEPQCADVTVNILPNRTVQGAGDFNTDSDGYIEMRLMYTEGVVRFDGTDYHIGLDSDGAIGYKFNIASPSFNLVPLRYHDAGTHKQEYPYIPSIAAAPSSECANTATESLLIGAYYLGAGIYTFPASPETDPPFDILWYDPADRNNSNFGYYNFRDCVTTSDSLSDPAIANAVVIDMTAASPAWRACKETS